MAYRSSTRKAGSSTASPEFAVPAGAAAGDIAVVIIFTDNGTATATPPTGFILKYESVFSAATRILVFWKRLTDADTGSYTFTLSASAWVEGACVLYSGRIGDGDPFTATSTANAQSASSLAAPNITAVGGDDLVGFGTSFNWGAWSPPAGMLERQDAGTSVTVDTADAVSAGSTGDKTFTTSAGASGMKVFLGALAVASASAPPEGSGAGTTTWTGAASGERDPKATGTGSTAWAGAAVGERTPVATATGATTWAGAATGSAPTVDGASGNATGSTTWAGVAVGQRTPVATGAGSTTWSGAATGTTTRSGAGVGVTTWTGTAFGTTADIATPPGRTANVTTSPRVAAVPTAPRTATIPADPREARR